MRPSYTKLEALMDAKGVKPADLTRELGFKSQSVFSDWKSGKSFPKIDKLVMIATYFGVAVEDLLEEDV